MQRISCAGFGKKRTDFFNANQPSTVRNIYYNKLTDLVHNVRTVVNSLQERDSSSEKKSSGQSFRVYTTLL